MRLKLALLAAKFTAFMLKVFGRLLHFNGTFFPGKVALKICPDFLKRVAKPKTVIAVTGTDGKTTTCNLLSDALEKCGMKVLNNRFGSNVYEGVVAAFLSGATLSNRCPYDIAVIEIDERSSHKIYPSLKPDYLVVTNLFRDSMKRNAHPEFIYNFIDKAMPEGCTLIQNADDTALFIELSLKRLGHGRLVLAQLFRVDPAGMIRRERGPRLDRCPDDLSARMAFNVKGLSLLFHQYFSMLIFSTFSPSSPTTRSPNSRIWSMESLA